MDIPSPTFHAWKRAEAELADIERAFRAMSPSLGSADRQQITQQLAALRVARLQVALLFEAVMQENAAMLARLAASEEPPRTSDKPSDRTSANDWLS